MLQLRISEIFLSLQGEANHTGWPTTFIRLTGCPLRCHYCDTAYSFSGGESLSIEDIAERIKTLKCQRICITGGEPLAQRALPELVDTLIGMDMDISIETSGSLPIQGYHPKVEMVMDLKTPASGEMERNDYHNIPYLKKSDQVKFVICNEDDYQWAKDQLAQYNLDKICTVLFSPATGMLDPRWLAEQILSDHLPVRFQMQLHKILWGEQHGR